MSSQASTKCLAPLIGSCNKLQYITLFFISLLTFLFFHSSSAHTNVISSCCFTQNGRYMCTASWDRTLQLWDVQTGSFRTRGGEQLSKGHNGSISSCAFSSDGMRVFLAFSKMMRYLLTLCCSVEKYKANLA